MTGEFGSLSAGRDAVTKEHDLPNKPNKPVRLDESNGPNDCDEPDGCDGLTKFHGLIEQNNEMGQMDQVYKHRRREGLNDDLSVRNMTLHGKGDSSELFEIKCSRRSFYIGNLGHGVAQS